MPGACRAWLDLRRLSESRTCATLLIFPRPMSTCSGCKPACTNSELPTCRTMACSEKKRRVVTLPGWNTRARSSAQGCADASSGARYVCAAANGEALRRYLAVSNTGVLC